MMNKYNPNIHHRRSIRLQEYDYSQTGLYFVTIVIKNRKNLFGEIVGASLVGAQNIVNAQSNTNIQMILNDAGKMVRKWYNELQNKFPDIQCHEMIIMPNHFHCIIKNNGSIVGADLRVCPNHNTGEHIGSPLHRVVQWFKTMTTNEYIRGVKYHNWQPFDNKLWQRNYWEHIIRNENEYHHISQYIIDNPQKWSNDKLNGGNGNIVMESNTDYGNEIWMI